MDRKAIASDLRSYKKIVDSDDVRFKEIIKHMLLDDQRILYALNNKELEDSDAEASDYYGVNILDYYMIEPTQTDVQNFLCFEVQFDEVARYNKVIKKGQIVFYILCEQKNIVDKDTGIARHDLMAAIIMDLFNWSNCFGNQIHIVSDRASVVDTKYACRTLVFEGEFTNSISKTIDGKTMVINNFGRN